MHKEIDPYAELDERAEAEEKRRFPKPQLSSIKRNKRCPTIDL